MVYKEIQWLWELMVRPQKTSNKTMPIEKTLGLYYKLSIVPFVIYLVIGIILGASGAASAAKYLPNVSVASLAAGSVISTIVAAILLFFIIVPVALAIDSFIYQIIGKNLLGAWSGDYSRTFTAKTFAVLPVIFFYWLLLLPGLNSLYLIVIPLWSIVILIIALSTQQKLKRTESVLVVIVAELLKAFFLILLASSILVGVASILGQLAGTYIPGIVPYISNSTGVNPLMHTPVI